jgi:hypothetical protein
MLTERRDRDPRLGGGGSVKARWRSNGSLTAERSRYEGMSAMVAVSMQEALWRLSLAAVCSRRQL